MTPHDAETLRLLRGLQRPVALQLATRLPASVRRPLRDGWIRDARAARYPDLSRAAAARALAADLLRRPEATALLSDILRLDGGQQLRWRQLSDILAETD